MTSGSNCFTPMSHPDPLFEVVTVRCFFGRCGHVEQATVPGDAHDAMERHYRRDHQHDIAVLVDPRRADWR